MNIWDVVFEQVKQVAAQQQKTLPPLSNDLRIMESGLDSLCLAILISRLDDELNVDPFDSDANGIPVTYGDLVRIYEQAVSAASDA
jgi:acyl carrier protein